MSRLHQRSAARCLFETFASTTRSYLHTGQPKRPNAPTRSAAGLPDNLPMRLLFLLLCAFSSMIHAQAISRSPMDLETASGVLHGSLVLPQRQSPGPVALLIAGSGPTDRNGNNPAGRNDSLRRLAQSLAQQGVATVRYDKRGIAASQPAAPDETTLSIEQYARDAADWSRKLAQDPRFSSVFLIGHSEGALVATLAANQAEIAGLITIAGTGRPLDQVIEEQLSTRLPAELQDESRTILDSLKAGRLYPLVDPKLDVLFRPSVQPFLISWLRQDPAGAFAKVHAPALVIQGDHDAQVGVEDAEALAKANPHATLKIIGGMNHVLRITPKDFEAQRASYNDPGLPVARELVTAISTFVTQTDATSPSS